MKAKREYTDNLGYMLEASTKAIQFVKDVDFETFSKNEEKSFNFLLDSQILCKGS